MAASTLRELVDSAAHKLRNDVLLAVTLTITALAPALILLGYIAGGYAKPSSIPLAVDIVIVATWIGVPLLLWRPLRRRIQRRFDEAAVARTAEEQLALPAGALRGALELGRDMPTGASPALAARSERLLAAQVANATPAQINGPVGVSWRKKRHRATAMWVALVAAVFVVPIVAPARNAAALAPLFHPIRHMKPPALQPIVVNPGDVSVTRGGSVDVRIRAEMRDAVTLHWHVQGDIAHEKLLPVLRDSAAYAITSLDGVTEYWVEGAVGDTSPHFTITPVDPLLLSELAVEVVYPAYLNRANEHYDGELPALELPQGTELLMRARATRPLARAALMPDSGAAIPLNTDASTISARWVPTACGTYSWSMRDAGGNDLAVQPPPIVLSIIRDAAPSVTITFPAVDTVFGPELALPIAAEAQDDHAVANASLVTWRVSRIGLREPPVETQLPFAAAADRVLLQTVLDASARKLTAGDTLKYFVRVRDNSPAAQVSESRTYSIRLPGLNELRDAATDQTSQLMKANEALKRAASKLQEDTRNTERRANAANTQRGTGTQNSGNAATPGGDRMQFAESQAAQKVLEQQQQMMANMDEMRAKVDALQKSLENAGLQDPDLQDRLAELRKLYDQAMTPEMRQKMNELKQGLDNLDPKQVENALKSLEQQQEALKKQLERSMQLMERAAAEQQMNKLTQEAKELSRQEDAHASALKQGQEKDPKAAAQRQEEIARKNDALAKDIDELREQLAKQGESRAAAQTNQAADSARAAQQSMKAAAQNEANGKQSDAQRDAQKASQQLDDAAQQLEKAREEMVKGWKDETQQSMQQATRDALSLAQRQQALKEQMDRAGSNMPKPGVPQPPAPQPQAGKQNEAGQKPAMPSPQQGATPQQSQQGRSAGAGGPPQQQGQQQSGRQGGPPQGGQNGQTGQSGQQSGQQSSPQQSDLASMRSEQSALQQGLQQLSKNIEETGDRTAQVNRDVASALNRANQSMQQTQSGLQNAQQDGQLPSEDAAKTVDALNKLALSLLKNSQEVQQSKDGTGMQQQMERMSDLAKQQGSLNGQGSSLMPMNIGQSAMSEQVRKLGQSQQQIAQQLEEVSKSGAQNQMLGRIDELAKEAAAIAQEMQGGRLEPQTIARQEKLFHRLLDAGRSLEKDEVSQERIAEKPVNARVGQPAALDPNLFKDGTKFRAPTPDELRALPPAYRKLILDYFERLNAIGK